jgi:hypothetical protein
MSDEEDQDDSEEEIKEIPLKKLADKRQKKRAKIAAADNDLLYGDESGSE